MVRPSLSRMSQAAVILALLPMFCGDTRAATADGDSGRPKIGLALSGGGARGVAHLGVLKVLEENRIPIDFIAGTSMGALVGGLYSTGLSIDELEKLVGSIDWSEILADHIPREDRSFRRKRDDDLYLMRHRPGIRGFSLRFPPGILDGQKVDLMLKRETLDVSGIDDFDDLSIPFRAVAADIVTGDAVVIGRGDLALALRASMALPGIFAPRMIDGRLLVDGGISCNLPIDVVRSMGADIVIAVDISTPLQGIEELGSVIAITNQLTGFLSRRNADFQIGTLGPGDIFILPELGDISTGSFERSMDAVPVGVRAAEKVLGRLRALSISEEEYEAYTLERTIERRRPVIDRIRIRNDSRIADGV
ncbi:MAG TPA: patatin-like phospholipase family protein, partial [Candidatus Krumholzibacterium sp.]|nr:patatin-like phospholipase family protein [Candidatus Krumholzibacterium sp.]